MQYGFSFFICFLSVIDLSIESLNWKRERERGGRGREIETERGGRKWQKQRDSFVSTQRDSWWVLMILLANFDAGN